MAKGRQQYFADEVSIQKEAREFAIEEQLKAKIDSVEEGAQVNVIETVKVNGEALIPDEEKAVDVDVPLVEDNLYSVDTEAALSARQGKVLYDYIQNLQSRGRYLSNWNSATGLPTTNPSESPYLYRAGDYFLVSNVSAGTNYKPDGSQYEIGVASETVETDTVMVSDIYIYDGSVWQLIKNGERPIVIDDRMDIASTNPVENRVITQALRTKQDTISDLQTIREGAAAGATAVQPGDNLSTLSGDSDDIVEGSSHLFMTPQERTKLGNQTGVNTGDETQATIMAKLGAASATTNGYLTAADWNTFNDKQDAIQDLQTIRENATAGKNASDTIATYGDIVTHDVSEFATAAQGAKADTALQSGDNVSELVNDAGYITDAYHDDTKQDVLIAGENITIGYGCITESDMKGPCLSGFRLFAQAGYYGPHERDELISAMTTLGLTSVNDYETYLFLPRGGQRAYFDGTVRSAGSIGYYLGAGHYDSAGSTRVCGLVLGNNYLTYSRDIISNIGCFIRARKNEVVVPDNTWTTVYDGSSIATNAGIFHNATLGLISISSDGTNWITMMDKNLGATIVYNRGDTLSEANCGKFYQRGNNYGFPYSGTIQTTTTKLDATGYGPGNYYYSDTFILNPSDTSGGFSVENRNMWGFVTRGTFQECYDNVISANDTTYVAGDFDIKDLADSTGKRAEWNAKQDALDLGANLSWGQDGKLNATDTTYTAGPGISISANNVISNTRTSAEWGNITGTLSDQTDLQSALDEKQNSFNVVDTLPDVSQADTNATYYLSVGDGKYEEWIVTEKDIMTFEADPNDSEDYIPHDVTFTEPKTLTFYNKTGDGRIEFYDPYGNYPHIIYGDAGEVITGGAEGWYYYDDNLWDYAYADASTYTIPAGTYTMISNGSYSTCYDTISFIGGGTMVKEWVKVGDTSSVPFTIVNELPSASAADENKIYILPIGNDDYEEWVIRDYGEGGFYSETGVTKKTMVVNDNDSRPVLVDDQGNYIDNVYLGFDNLQSTNCSWFVCGNGSSSYADDYFIADHDVKPLPYVSNVFYDAGAEFEGSKENYSQPFEASIDVYYSTSPIIYTPGGKQWVRISATNKPIKIFTVTDTSGHGDYQPAIDWIEAGNNAIIRYHDEQYDRNNYYYYVSSSWDGTDTTKHYCFLAAGFEGDSEGPTRVFYFLEVTADENLVVQDTDFKKENITSLFRQVNRLDGNTLHKGDVQPYTPTTDYSPATKKYVDDAVAGISGGKNDIIVSHSEPSDDTVLWINDASYASEHPGMYYYDSNEGSWQSIGGIISSSTEPDSYNQDKIWLNSDGFRYFDDDTGGWQPIGGIIKSTSEPYDYDKLWLKDGQGDYDELFYYDNREGSRQPIGGIIKSTSQPYGDEKLWLKDGQGMSSDELLYYDDEEGSWQPVGGIIKSTSAPYGEGKLWLKDGQGMSSDELLYYDDEEGSWQPVGGIIKSDTAPNNYDKLWLKTTVTGTDGLFYFDYDSYSWLPVGGNPPSWGDITGTLADQTDLKNALDAKMDGMTILSYGHSTWQEFLNAYNNNRVVYCRASSNSNPGTGNQGRMAFMAYIETNNTGTPTSVEFQYYRSRSSHDTAANQLDEVYVYKLTNSGTWSVTQRNTAAKAVAGTGISLGYGSGNMTISVDTTTIATKSDLANFAGFLVVAQLPTTDIKTNIIYLLGPVGTGADKYEEYIYSNNNWIMIGDTTIDLSPYFHKTNDDSDDIIEGSTNLFLTPAERTLLGNTSGTNSGDETKASIQTKLGAASSSNSGYLTLSDWDTFNNKQNALSTQTAYTSKGSATKVPQITTNSLGQVTGITEVDIQAGETYNAGEGIEIKNGPDYSAMQGPAPDGFHVPLNTEWQAVYDIWTALGGGSSDGTNFGIALKLPLTGDRSAANSNVRGQGSYGSYWSSSRYGASYAYYLFFNSTTLIPQNHNNRTYGFSIRCFKNTPTVPTSSWTKLYGTSIEAGGIFWSSTDGLISLSSDGTNWITIADKNLGATTVWNSGDTLSEANSGKYYQWGNNYGFPFTGSVTNSSTQVDASTYGPGNYYSSSTFITRSSTPFRWDTTDNANLWGGETGVVTLENAITNTGVLSVNGQTGDVVITSGESNTKTFYLSSTSDLTTAQAAYDWYLAGKNPIIVYDNVTYIVISKITSGIYFGATLLNGGSNSYSATYECGIKSILFNLSGNTVDRIYINSTYAPIGGAKEFLALHQNYSTPYTPEYDGSPATKKYVDDTVAGAGDMSYSDFGWQAKTGATVTLDLASTITPSANFTVNAPSTIKDGQTYILRVNNGATVYTMTLGTNVTNPYGESLALTASGIDQFVFLAIGGNLELQPNANGGGGGGSGGFGTLLASYADVAAPTTLPIPTGTKLVVLETDRGGKMNTIFISADTLLSQGVDRQYSTYGYTDYDSFVTVNYDFSAGTFKVVGYNWSSAPNVYFYG